MSMMLRLQTFIKSIIEPTKIELNKPPHTYESYAMGLKELISPFIGFLVEHEKNLMKRNQFTQNTSILSIYREMEKYKYFQLLEYLNKIHSTAVLDYSTTPSKFYENI